MTNMYNEKKIPTLTEAQRKFARNLYARIYAYHENYFDILKNILNIFKKSLKNLIKSMFQVLF